MSTQAETLEQKAVREAALWLQCAVEDAKSLQTVERTLVGVVRTEFHRVAEQYDTSALREAMRALNQANAECDVVRIHEIRERAENEFHLWRLFISRYDEEIMPYSLRRFCERTDQTLDATAFAALTRYYRGCPRTNLTQSKYDLAVTRLFAPVGTGNRRVLRMNRAQMIEHLGQMYAAWDGAAADAVRQSGDGGVERAVAEFESFIAEVEKTAHFEELITRDLPNRIRALKGSLGETFYTPEVTAASIEYNVVAANKFSSLFDDESEQIRNAPGAGRELADLFSDVSPGAPDQIARVLEELRMCERDEEAEAGERLGRLARLLNIGAGERDDAGVDEAGGGASAADTAAASSSTDDAAAAALDEEALRSRLSELSQDEANKEIVADFLKASSEVRGLDPAAFLGALSGENTFDDRALRRRGLALIIQADALLRSRLAKEEPLDPETETRLSVLLEELQSVGKSLRKVMSDALNQGSRSHVDTLLYATNHVLEARLRLQSAIVRRSASEFAKAEAARARRESEEEQSKVVRLKGRAAAAEASAARPRHRLRKALIAAAVLLVVASIALRLSVQSSAPAAVRDAEVQVLNRAEMPGGELFTDARRRREVLICIVNDSWKRLGEDKRREAIQSLQRYGKPLGVESVMLLDGEGLPVGSASQTQVNLEADFAAAR